MSTKKNRKSIRVTLQKVPLYINTIRYMRLKQVVAVAVRKHLLKRTCNSKCLKHATTMEVRRDFRLFIEEIDGSSSFMSRFKFEEISRNVFTFFYESHRIDLNDWKASASPLWEFTLHYFEYGVFLGYLFKKERDEKYYLKAKELIESWLDISKKSKVALHPYPTSLRIINLFIIIQLIGNRIKQDVSLYRKLLYSIYEQYRTLILRREIWLCGNHYLENLFTIVVSSFIFKEDKVFKRYLHKLKKELQKQILPDGMHYELSPMYHKIIYVDMLRLKQISEHPDFPHCQWIDDILNKMYNAFCFFNNGFGRTALFNDSGSNVARDDNDIAEASNRLVSIRSHKDDLTHAGYYRLDNEKISVIIDAGEIGPTEMPGHGHCDCLSFEVAMQGKIIFSNSGTYKYQGSKRGYFRSTRAHNTVMLDGYDQSECWAEHRVAKRIKKVIGRKENNTFCGSYINYKGQPHKRKIRLNGNEITVLDYAKDGTEVESYLHIPPAYVVSEDYKLYDGINLIAEIKALCCVPKIVRQGEICQQSTEFGKIEMGSCVVFKWLADEKVEHGYRIILKEN